MPNRILYDSAEKVPALKHLYNDIGIDKALYCTGYVCQEILLKNVSFASAGWGWPRSYPGHIHWNSILIDWFLAPGNSSSEVVIRQSHQSLSKSSFTPQNPVNPESVTVRSRPVPQNRLSSHCQPCYMLPGLGYDDLFARRGTVAITAPLHKDAPLDRIGISADPIHVPFQSRFSESRMAFWWSGDSGGRRHAS